MYRNSGIALEPEPNSSPSNRSCSCRVLGLFMNLRRRPGKDAARPLRVLSAYLEAADDVPRVETRH